MGEIKVKITIPDNVSETIRQIKINRLYDILKPKEAPDKKVS